MVGALGVALAVQFLITPIAHRQGWYAVPNARSLHTRPTVTVGGISIVVPVVCAFGYLQLIAPTHHVGITVLAGAFVLLSVIGFWDDLADLPRLPRLVVQLFASSAVVAGLGASWLAQVELFVTVLYAVGFVLGLTWFTNAFNFMDGIDGLAACQSLVFCVGVQVLALGVPDWSGLMLWTVAAASLVFLAWNWSPAKVFMGDVGSLPLGFLLAALALHLWWEGFVSLWASLILLTVFWLDASYTLGVRIVSGQRFTEAHRSHMYQRVAERYGHSRTTQGFVVFAVAWLLPMAWLAQTQQEYAWVFIAVSATPIAVLCVRFRAGKE